MAFPKEVGPPMRPLVEVPHANEPQIVPRPKPKPPRASGKK
jgi:hypothetical protein